MMVGNLQFLNKNFFASVGDELSLFYTVKKVNINIVDGITGVQYWTHF